MRILFLIPAPPGISPGQRFRFEHYLAHLRAQGADVILSPFYTLDGWKGLFRPGHFIAKAVAVLRGFTRRCFDLLRLSNADYVFVFREAAPLGPPVFEWIIARVLRKKLIYDFDDAIWLPVVSHYNAMVGAFRWHRKTASICRWAHQVSVGNEYLAEFARRYNSRVTVIPTVVDTAQAHNRIRDHQGGQLIVGWTGTFSTLKYLSMVVPALKAAQEQVDFTFVVIADRDPALPLRNYRFIRWRSETEIDDLLCMHVGLMPLFDDEFSKGKCGFKAIQYMALGIPALVSPVGVNASIVEDGKSGFVCSSPAEWQARLIRLLEDAALRARMGAAARARVEADFSVAATQQRFLSLFSESG